MGDDIYLIAIDVGSAEVRAALVNHLGKVISVSTKKIQIWSPHSGFFQQSSENIWQACCTVVKEVIKGINAAQIKGIGCDATCSLVVVGEDGEPLSVSPKGEEEQNVIMWMDHRARKEADFINSLKHPLLKYVGGNVSLEMQMPKLLWLKNNLSNCYLKAHKFFDLPDFLVWKLTGSDTRSLCSVVCKWMYSGNPTGEIGWDQDFLKQIGLGGLVEHSFSKIGCEVKKPGERCGQGVLPEVAQLLGLAEGTPVSTSIIDAHAGGIGLVATKIPGNTPSFCRRLSLICGTSTCHMRQTVYPVFVRGVWGPYYSAMMPGLWLNEGGQSATGILVDKLVESHPAYEGIRAKLKEGQRVVEFLNALLEDMAARQDKDVDCLTSQMHVYPDFRGNRSPLADPSLKGMISGLDLNYSEEHLALLYLAAIQSLAYGTRQIVEALEENCEKVEWILVCGGLSKNDLFVQTHANALLRPVVVPSEPECVLLGSAVLAATAASIYPTVQESALSMASPGNLVAPNQKVYSYHEKKYEVFNKMLKDQKEYIHIMSK